MWGGVQVLSLNAGALIQGHPEFGREISLLCVLLLGGPSEQDWLWADIAVIACRRLTGFPARSASGRERV